MERGRGWCFSVKHRLVGLVVKASASRAEDPGFESRLRRDFFGVVVFCSFLFYSILLYSVLFYSILLCSVLFCFILFFSILF